MYTSKDLKNFLFQAAEAVEKNKDYLSELDRKLGDGDHGVTMSVGWQAILKSLNSDLQNEEVCSKILMTAGRSFLSAVGSSVGPLYATAFMRGAKAVQNKTALNDEDLKNFWVAFIEGIQERGHAEAGDKTMMDALFPAAETLNLQFKETGSFQSSFAQAVESAKKGAEATKDMLSKRGRSSRLGERSLGCQDPGAASAVIILSAFLSALNPAKAI